MIPSFTMRARKLMVAVALVALPFASRATLAQELPPERDGIDGIGDLAQPPEAKPAQQPFSIELGVALDNIPAVTLGAVDVAALLAEDAATDRGGKCLRYGVARELQVSLADGATFEGADGSRLWVVDIVATGAIGIRVHFTDMALPPGGRIVVYSPADPTNVSGPYEDRGLLGDGQFWTPTRAGERVRIEYHQPAVKPGFDMPANPFRIDRIQHIYLDPTAGFDPREGNCHNDVLCFPAYSNLKEAVGGLGFINPDALYCTGQLLNTVAGDLTPYFLTANHCLSNNGTAQTSEIYWRFQTASCNGAPPALGSVPQSAVCTLLSTGVASDYTLLMVEGTLPGGHWWSGWATGTPGDGTDIVGIHHPDGAFKRISFGTKSGATSCGGGSHIRANWSSGVTEPGSSGSGLFRVDNQRLVGQLHCGPSVCGGGSLNDQYGAFSATYPNIQTLLDVGGDDSLEDNDSCGAARLLGAGAYSGLIVKSTDADWYRIVVPGGGGSVSVQLSFTHAFGDVDMQLYNACGGSVVASSTGTGNSESLLYVNNGGTASFYLNTYLFRDTRNGYSMSIAITTPAPQNDSCGLAQYVNEGTVTGSTLTATNDGQTTCGLSNTTADVWFLYYAQCAGPLRLQTCGSGFDTVLSVHSDCPGTAANTLVCNDDCRDGSFPCSTGLDSCVVVNVTPGTYYYIRVGGFNGASGSFSLNIDLDVPTPANDACGAAPTIGLGSLSGTTCGATRDGSASCGNSNATADVWYRFVAFCSGTLAIDTAGSGYDTVLSAYASCGGAELACNDDCPSGGLSSCITIPVTSGTAYILRVSGFAGSVGNFNLNLSLVAPINDACGNATQVVEGTYNGITCGSTNDGSANCGASQNAPDSWFEYTPTCSGIVSIDTCGSNYDTVLSAHTGCPGTISNQIACDDDCDPGVGPCPGTLQSCIMFPVTAGTPYVLRVSGFVGGVGNYVLNIHQPVPFNDACANATAIGVGQTAFDTCNATTDGPAACGGMGNDIWYRLRARCDGLITLDTCAFANYDTVLAAYSGTCGALAQLTCNDDSCGLSSRIALNGVAGQSYLIRVGGFNGQRGAGTLTILDTCCPGPADGDMNGSGVTDADDSQRFVDAAIANSMVAADVCHGDFTGDGVVNAADAPGMVAALLGP